MSIWTYDCLYEHMITNLLDLLRDYNYYWFFQLLLTITDFSDPLLYNNYEMLLLSIFHC